ncbi:MAG: tRNA (guanine(46)-N(7))-methyltransferase TrmB [Pseudotabrizicola sp.]|uniref:tRNA (guanine(46)-N(7))-methyltransferase TrmB n=1 Tax=Pseudotabrizicola sp. TaxID=2939647 RepID=UPI002720AD7A|nr:tRNA (guanine(46)-N(7))-methyltransferase TrmB [Pseudotabrizicola sp.]MDO9640038.1 tRNA (guanine(46)-N(7))-methyltransferase TrmB [Pseudotabrizicola sp.]
MAEPTERRNFYGRVHGKTLRASQKDYLENDLESLRLPGVTVEDNPDRTPLDIATLFPTPRPLWVEVGFGGGEHLVHMAALYPQVGIIGCEPFVNGIAMLLGKIRTAGVTNLWVHPGDVRDLFDVLPTACVDKVFLNYPDPWPKARHHRRRFVTPGYLALLARVMKPGAEFRVATDIEDYVRQTLEEVPVAGFDLIRQTGEGEAWDDWISTRYEQKALREGRAPHYLTFLRKG